MKKSVDLLEEMLDETKLKIDYTLVMVTDLDKETYLALISDIMSYCNGLPCYNYFVLNNIRDRVLTPVLSSPVLYHYFKTLDHLLISSFMSKFNMSYSELVDALINFIRPTLSDSRQSSVLDDKMFAEQKVDIENITDVLKSNSIIVTIYLFRVTMMRTEAYSAYVNN